mmetsp:Transcript_44911/g.67600  ORF Transcript_44911/g.67600 Transcript_44911/m.67600 type:complete len:551 (+) Transcript_44911:62-1714(+)
MAPKQNEKEEETYPLGMDHRAIVWCHNVLDVVRKIIQAMTIYDHIHNIDGSGKNKGKNGDLRNIISSSTKKEWIARVLKKQHDINYRKRGKRGRGEEKENIFHYKDEVLEQEHTLIQSYGFFQALAMKSAMPYNLSSMVNFYTLTALLDQAVTFIHWHYQKTATLHLLTPNQHFLAHDADNAQFSLFFSFTTCTVSVSQSFVRFFMTIWGGSGDGRSFNNTFVDSISSAILCFLASILYFSIAQGLPVLVSRLYSQCRRKNVARENEGRTQIYGDTLHSLMIKQLLWFGVSILFVLGGSCAYVTCIKSERFTINAQSTIAIIFLSLVFIIFGNLFALVVRPSLSKKSDILSVLEEKDKLKSYQIGFVTEHANKRKNMTVALLLPIMPFLMAGKVVYASSMLTNSGQIDLSLLDKFHAAPGVSAGIFRDDQCRFVVLCLPILLLFCTIRHTMALGMYGQSQCGEEKSKLEHFLHFSRFFSGRKRTSAATILSRLLLCMHIIILLSFYLSTLQMGSGHLVSIAISASSLIQVAEHLFQISLREEKKKYFAKP